MRYEASSAAAPSEVPTLGAALLRLGALASADLAALEAIVRTLPEASGSREAFESAVRAAAPYLAPLVKPLGGSLLARYLTGGPSDEGEVEPKHLPKAARKALKEGDVVASADADVWIMVPKKDGQVQVSHAHPESFEILGETIPEWLLAEAGKIEAARTKKPKAKVADGKGAIDAALARLVELSGAPTVAGKLGAVAFKRTMTKWAYFSAALKACGSPWSPEVLAETRGRLLGRLLSGAPHDGEEPVETEEGDDDLDGINPIYVRRYPRDAQKPMQQVRPGHFVASSGAEVWFIVLEAQGAPSSWAVTLHHAAHDGYELLGASVEEWLTREVDRVEAGLLRRSPA